MAAPVESARPAARIREWQDEIEGQYAGPRIPIEVTKTVAILEVAAQLAEIRELLERKNA